MAVLHAKSGEVIDIRPLGSALARATTTTLVKTKVLEVIRLVIPAGKHISEHRAPGEITVQCLEGRVAFKAGTNAILKRDNCCTFPVQSLIPFSGIEDSSVLLTILL